MSDREVRIEGGAADSFELSRGESIDILCAEGSQVVDTWAFVPAGFGEYLSMAHTRSCLQRLSPRPGDGLYSNRRRVLLRLIEDTSPGVHDLLLSACDPRRYELLGHAGYHANCADNLRAVLARHGHEPSHLPDPFNLFEHVTLGADGALAIAPPLVSAGEGVRLRAETDLLLVLSACPMDLALTNGADGRTRPVACRVHARQDPPALPRPGKTP